MKKKPFRIGSTWRLKAPSASEQQLHQAVAELLDWLLLPPVLYTTFPAGWGDLPKATSGRLKACGMKTGMPDILVFAMFKVIGIELKVGNNKLSNDQVAMHAALTAVGVQVYICRSQEDVIAALKREGVALRRHWMDKHGDESTEGRSAPQSP